MKPDNAQGRLVVISGPSGAGKTSVCRALKKDPNVEFSVSATTRGRRQHEVDGKDYHFLTEEDFRQRREAGEFLEWASYNDCYYGTLRAPMDKALADGKLFVLEIEVQGTEQLRDAGVDGLFIFVVPPGPEELRRRLERRGTDSPEQIENRLAIAARELGAADLYDHVVVNENLEEAIDEVRRLIKGQEQARPAK